MAIRLPMSKLLAPSNKSAFPCQQIIPIIIVISVIIVSIMFFVYLTSSLFRITRFYLLVCYLSPRSRYPLNRRHFVTWTSLSSLVWTTESSDFETIQPAIQWVPGALSPGVKRQKYEADRSPTLVPSSRKRESIHLFSIHLHGVVLSYLSTETSLRLPFYCILVNVYILLSHL
jgi:hypothetical protein